MYYAWLTSDYTLRPNHFICFTIFHFPTHSICTRPQKLIYKSHLSPTFLFLSFHTCLQNPTFSFSSRYFYIFLDCFTPPVTLPLTSSLLSPIFHTKRLDTHPPTIILHFPTSQPFVLISILLSFTGTLQLFNFYSNICFPKFTFPFHFFSY